MAEQNSVICRNCIHHTTGKTLCGIWNKETMREGFTRDEMRDLFHEELGGIAFTNVDMPRFCKHFSGRYVFPVGEQP